MCQRFHSDDLEVVRLLKEGQEMALEAIYRRYWQQLYDAANAILKDQAACEDIIQEVFLNLWLRRESLELHTSLGGYLFTSVRHEVFRQIRSGKVREDIFDHIVERIQAGPDYHDIEYRELRMQISLIVERLPEKCRAVYKLSREEHLSHKEIARQLNISTKTVENHLTKALSFLRLSLGQVLTIELLSFLMHR